MDEADTSRRNILRLVRKSASADYNSTSFEGADEDYPEHRIKFLECRKQFEQPPPRVDKRPPFLPHWIKPEYDTDLSITYKKKGAEITDLRINYLDNSDGNSNEIGIQNKSNEPDVKEEPRALGNSVSIDNRRRNQAGRFYLQNVNVNFLSNREEANSVGKTAADENLFGKSNENAKRPMEKQSRISTKSIRKSQSLRIVEERSSSFDIPRKNQSIITNYSIPRKPFVCRLIIRRPIELKKYDHIVTNLINNKK